MKLPSAAVLSLSLTVMAAAWWHAQPPLLVPGAATASPVAAPLALSTLPCRPLECSWSAPGFVPELSRSEVWALPCPSLQAVAPGTPGDYLVTLMIRCVYQPERSSSLTRVVVVEPIGFRDGFETGDTSRWSWRVPA